MDMVLGIWILSLLSKTGDQCNDVVQVTRPVGEHFKRNVTGLDGHQGVNKMKRDECKGFLSSTVVSIQMGVGAVGAVVQKPCRQRMTPWFLLDANPPSTQLVMLILCVPNSISFSARWLWRGQILVLTHLTLLNCCVRVYIHIIEIQQMESVKSMSFFGSFHPEYHPVPAAKEFPPPGHLWTIFFLATELVTSWFVETPYTQSMYHILYPSYTFIYHNIGCMDVISQNTHHIKYHHIYPNDSK